MPRRSEDCIRLTHLNHTSEIHHRDPVGEMSHNAQVVRHEQDREPKVALKIQQQIEYLRLHRNIQ